MDSFQFVNAAAAILSTINPTVLVMLTSSPADKDIRRAKELPLIRDFLIKPLVVDKALEILARYLGQGTGSEA